MKITIIHGQNHKGSTYTVARELAEKLGGEITEFFLPRDFAQPCLGCTTCFKTDLTHCPHFEKLQPLAVALLSADVILLDSPVYVYHANEKIKSPKIKTIYVGENAAPENIEKMKLYLVQKNTEKIRPEIQSGSASKK
mgnify:FL=1